MTGEGALRIWKRAVEVTADFRAQAQMGLPQGYERLAAAGKVLQALKEVLIDAVSESGPGFLVFLGRVSLDLHEIGQVLDGFERDSSAKPEPASIVCELQPSMSDVLPSPISGGVS